MRIFIKSLKENNKGSSLVMALVAIAFIGILGTVILSASVTEYQLKTMDNKSKRTFYSAETALEELYAGMGELCYTELENAYSDTVAGLLENVNINGDDFLIRKDNETANLQMKQKYYNAMKNTFKTANTNDTAKFLTNAYIDIDESDYDLKNARVKSIGSIIQYDSEYKVVLNDVLVEYKETEQDFYSTVTVDIEIEYPDANFDFTGANNNTLDTYLDYCLIAMDKIDVSAPSVTVSGGVFAGNNGLTIAENSNLNLVDLVNNNGVTETRVVTPSMIKTLGNLNIGNADIWCDNIIVGEAGKKTSASLVSDGILFVKDDLTVSGDNCNVTLGNEYWGYSSSGTLAAADSSAIIINGKSCKMDLSQINSLVLAGKAYLDFNKEGAAAYMTADSMALKGNQEIYLVPSQYISSSDDAIKPSNPCRVNPAENGAINVDLSNFFAYKMGLLNSSDPYIVKNIDGAYYLYLNFADSDGQIKYVKCIADKTYFTNLHNASADDLKDWQGINNVLIKSLNKFVADGSLSINNDANIYSSGTLFQISGDDDKTLTTTNISNYADFLTKCSNKNYRYKVLQSFLADLGDDAVSGNAFTINGTKYENPDLTMSVYNRIIDTSEKTGVAGLKKNIVNISGDTIAAVIVEKAYTVPSTVNGGVILAYNQNVTVNNNFQGLIITNKKIYVKDQNCTITTGITDIASRTLDVNPDVSKYFLTYDSKDRNDDESGSEYGELNAVTLEKMLSFINWRKNDAN